MSYEVAEAQAARQALARVLAGRTFAGSARLASFLRFVCEESLAGRAGELNEGTIARHVFGRPEHFNPGEDSIVRSTARLLRQRLQRYYEDEGANDPWRIALPRGSYVPVFAPRHDVAEAPAQVPPAALPEGQPAAASKSGQLPIGASRRRLMFAGAMVTASAVGVGAVWTANAWRQSPMDRVWRLLLAGPRRLLIVPADSGLVMRQTDLARQLSLEEYTSLSRAAADPASPLPGTDQQTSTLQGQRYTGVVSVRLAVELTRLAGSAAGVVGVRYARDLHINELKECNAVLVGAAHANPWVGLFASRCVHRIDWQAGEGFSLVTTRLRADDPPAPRPSKVAGDMAFAHIALKRNLGGRGHVLLVSGTGSQGTDGGIDFLFDTQGLAKTLHTAGAGRSLDEFEVLVRCRIRNGQNAGYDVIAARVTTA